jgi:hypothetical protein
MTDPMITIATAEILKLAFNEFIKTSAGESAKKLTGAALDKSGELQQKIVSWFRNKQDVKAEKAIAAIREQGSLEALNKLTTYLDDEMEAEPIFALELESFVEEIIKISGSTRQIVASDIKASEVEIDGVRQIAKQPGTAEQTIGKNIESTGKVVFRNLNQGG